MPRDRNSDPVKFRNSISLSAINYFSFLSMSLLFSSDIVDQLFQNLIKLQMFK
jgi:hypothetical protein